MKALLLVICSVIILLVSVTPSLSQAGTTVAPTRFIQINPAKLVYPPNVPMSPAAMHLTKSPLFRPTMGDAAYRGAKLEAMQAFGQKGSRGSNGARANAVGSVVAFKGLTQSGSKDLGIAYNTSGANGAIGLTQYAEVTNDALAVYSRTGALRKTTPLSAFFGYTTESMVDPTVKYDWLWNRWIVVATSLAESATVQYLHIAVSTSDNAEGSYYIYQYNVAFHSGDDWDWGRTGLTQDAVLFDANVFNGDSFSGATFFSVAKALLYNGHGISVPVFEGLGGTLTLPIVQDQEANAYLMYNEPGTPYVGIYTVTNAANGFDEGLAGPAQFDIGSTYNVPPPATQPGSASTLDTLDTRFLGNLSQDDGGIVGVNCIGSGSRPTNEVVNIYYAASPSEYEVQPFYVSSTSNDFNPCLTRDYNEDYGIVWTSTDPTLGIQAAIYVDGAISGTSPPYPYGLLVLGSNTFFGKAEAVFAWGECSSVSVDPTDGKSFWGTSQLMSSVSSWKTESFHFVAQ